MKRMLSWVASHVPQDTLSAECTYVLAACGPLARAFRAAMAAWRCAWIAARIHRP